MPRLLGLLRGVIDHAKDDANGDAKDASHPLLTDEAILLLGETLKALFNATLDPATQVRGVKTNVRSHFNLYVPNHFKRIMESK